MRTRSCLSILMLMMSLLAGCAVTLGMPSDTDPHRWLESSVASPRVMAWLEQQAQATRSWQQQQPNYRQVREQLQAAWDHPKWMVADIKQGQVFFYFNAGLDDHYSLYQQTYRAFMADRARGRAPIGRARKLLGDEIFVDNARPGSIAISPDAQWLAYQISQRMPSGHQQSLWYLQSLTDASAAPVLLSVNHGHWTLPAERLTWGHDGESLFFSVSVPPETLQTSAQDTFSEAGWQPRVYAYRRNMSAPELIYVGATSRHIENLYASGSGLVLAVAADAFAGEDNNTLRWAVIEPETAGVGELVRARWLSEAPGGSSIRDAGQYIGDIRGVPAFLAPGALGTGAVILAGAHQSRTLIRESDAPLRSALVLGDRLVLEYLEHGSSTLQVVDLDGRLADGNGQLTLPAPVRIEALQATGEHQFLVSYSGILTPPRSVLIDLRSGQQTTLTHDQPNVAMIDLRASLVRVRTPDGTRIPLWLAGSGSILGRDLDLTLLEVYGGFAAPMDTSFSISRLVWIANGGALAVAGPRGGGDYGAIWHKAGSGERRHNSIADVLAVADWLHGERMSDNGRLAISGRSHGGLLAAEVVHRAPDMFAALVTEAAVFDLMRLDALGGAPFWRQEYHGATSSPYQTLLAGGRELSGHPPTLLITRANDAVVAPAHSFKYLQALQENPSLTHVDALLVVTPGRDHDTSGRVVDLINDYALRWTFLNNSSVMGPASESLMGE